MGKNKHIEHEPIPLHEGRVDFEVGKAKDFVRATFDGAASFDYAVGHYFFSSAHVFGKVRQKTHHRPYRKRQQKFFEFAARVMCGGGDVFLNQLISRGNQGEQLEFAVLKTTMNKQVEIVDLAYDDVMHLTHGAYLASHKVKVEAEFCNLSHSSLSRFPTALVLRPDNRHDGKESRQVAVTGAGSVYIMMLPPGGSLRINQGQFMGYIAKKEDIGSLQCVTMPIAARFQSDHSIQAVFEARDHRRKALELASASDKLARVWSMSRRLNNMARITINSLQSGEGLYVYLVRNNGDKPITILQQSQPPFFPDGPGVVGLAMRATVGLMRIPSVIARTIFR